MQIIDDILVVNGGEKICRGASFDMLNDREKIDLGGFIVITNIVDLVPNLVAQVVVNVVITDGTNTITLVNVALANLDVNDFLF